jgi:DNA-binding NarL/FixJ family response regulator
MILVVDHDPVVLEKAVQVLNRDRQVLLASDPKQAFDMVQSLAVKVVLVDMDIPGKGDGLIRALHQAVPEVRIIVTSSASYVSLPEEAENLGVVEVLSKPITSDWKPVVERVRATYV